MRLTVVGPIQSSGENHFNQHFYQNLSNFKMVKIIQNPANTVFHLIALPWCVQIKPAYLKQHVRRNGIQVEP